MRTRRIHSHRERGISLLEILVYMGLFVVVTGFATILFFQTWDDSRGLRRDADDIVRALHAGDEWRADIRKAAGPISVSEAKGVQQLHIPSASGEIVYEFTGQKVLREAGSVTNRVVLANVKGSRMEPDSRPDIKAWRWELELTTAKKTAYIRPLFTFEAVAGGSVIQ